MPQVLSLRAALPPERSPACANGTGLMVAIIQLQNPMNTHVELQSEGSPAERAHHVAKLAELIRDVEIAMLTTVNADGRLISRPLGTQEVEFDGDLWFATECDSGKALDIARNPNVNVSYASKGRNTYVSVAGRASIVRDRAKIEAFWSAGMQVFFPHGKDDPNLCLIRVEAETAEFWDGPGTAMGKALDFMLTAVTGDVGALTENERIDLR